MSSNTLPGPVVPSPGAPTVAIVLPHREAFGPAAAGAVAMVVRRLAAGPSRYRALVIGPPFQGPGFPDIPFLPARAMSWLPLTPTGRYAAGVARALARLPPPRLAPPRLAPPRLAPPRLAPPRLAPPRLSPPRLSPPRLPPDSAPGLIEVHNKPDVALWLARLFPQRRVSLFLHNDPRTMRGARSPRARQRLLHRLARIVTVSDFVRRALLDGVDQEPDRPPLVLHNALDPGEVPEGLPPAQRDKVILFAGRVVPDKGPDLFIAACARALPRLPGWRAEMIGADGFQAGAPDSGYVRTLRPAAAEAGVAMLGARSHAEVLQAMARAAIVVVPSRWAEPFGLTALEAMACGSALVCSGHGGLAEVAGEAALLADPEDTEAFAGALLRLAGDEGLRAALSAAGMQRARGCFSVADAVAQLDDLRDQALAM